MPERVSVCARLLQLPPLSAVIVVIIIVNCGLYSCVFERVVFGRWRWYFIRVRVTGLWLGEDQVGRGGIGGQCSGDACMWGK